MSFERVCVGLVALALVAGFTWSSAAADQKTKEKAGEVKLSLKDVPAAVRKTLTREAMGAKIQTIDKEQRDGKTVYETDVEIDGQNYQIIVDPKGKLLGKTLDDEETEKASAKEEKGEKSGKAKEADEDEKPQKSAKKSKAAEDDDEKSSKSDKKNGKKAKGEKENQGDKEDNDK
jgi:hypothetical protein